MLNGVIEFANKRQKLTYQALSLFVTMDDRHIEIEPYEEIVDRAEVFSIVVGVDRLVQNPSIGVSHLRSC